MFKREEIPVDALEVFDAFRKSGVVLKRETPLMPVFEIKGLFKFARTIKALSRIKTLPSGTELVFERVRLKGSSPWYYVRVKDSAVRGWINSLILKGGI